MIENTNQSFENKVSNATVVDGDDISSFIKDLNARRQNVLKGGVNCIPLPFPRFRSELPGIEQGQYVLISANTKVGKTNLADFVYVFHALDYAYEHPEKCSVHIIYFALEESKKRITERYFSYLLNKLDGIRISPADLRSTSVDFPAPQEVIDKLSTGEYARRLEFFEKCVQFETEETNPTGVLRVCERYAKSVGNYKSHKITAANNSFKEVDVFDSYTQNDPNHYKIVVIDHIGLNTRRAA